MKTILKTLFSSIALILFYEALSKLDTPFLTLEIKWLFISCLGFVLLVTLTGDFFDGN